MRLDAIWRWCLRLLGFAEPPRDTTVSPQRRRAAAEQGIETASSAPSAGSMPAVEPPPTVLRTTPSRGPEDPRASVADLIIGLDFGTAATKVVIRSPWMYDRRARAVSFGELGHETSPYLLPTRLWEDERGHLNLASGGRGRWLTELKLGLMRDERDGTTSGSSQGDGAPLLPATAYLCLVLREARERFLAVEHDAYGHFTIRWQLNLGIPSAGYDDAGVRERFQHVARAAWWLSLGREAVTRASAATALRWAAGSTRDFAEIQVVPEVAAQVVGYARSTLRNPGLHLLIDVGASTLDICGFVLHEWEHQDRYALLTASVDRLGVFVLHTRRLAALRCLRGRDGRGDEGQDPLRRMPDSLAEYHPGCACASRDVDDELAMEAVRAVMKHLVNIKTRRDRNSARWREGLPVFLCGGGSSMSLYGEVVKTANRRLRSTMLGSGLRVRVLPKPERLANDDVIEEIYHRLSVAYGLSFDALDIGEITPPGEIEDIPRPRRRDPDIGFVSKDQV